MKFPESWLREHVTLAASRDELAAALTAIGLEVEGIEPVGAPPTLAPGAFSSTPGSLSVSGESSPIRLSGIPCHSCATNAPDTAYRLTSPNPWVTTTTRARAVRQSPRSDCFFTVRMPRAAASACSRSEPTSQTAG